jgi:hypothetical protein
VKEGAMRDGGWILLTFLIGAVFWGLLFGVAKAIRRIAALPVVERALAPIRRGVDDAGKGIDGLFAGVFDIASALLVLALVALVLVGIVGILWFGVRQIF